MLILKDPNAASRLGAGLRRAVTPLLTMVVSPPLTKGLRK
jgi:hypothetical protein